MSVLSAEAMKELREHLELDAIVEETTAEELNLAIQAIREVEAEVEDVTPSSTSSGKKGKCASGKARTPMSRKRTNDDDDDDDFQNPPPRKTPRFSSGGKKNMAIVMKNLRSPSPTPSTSSASSVPNQEWLNFMDEEEQRRTAEKTRREEWHRRAAGDIVMVKKKMTKALERVSVVKGELIALRNQKESLRDEIRVIEERLRNQIRGIEERELILEREKQSSLQAAKRYEAIVARFNEMSI